MEPVARPVGIVLTPEQALGRPLNEVEKRNAPAGLYLAGDPSLLTASPRVAIVGSRKASEEGELRAARLARVLVEHGVTVVSGLALGIDTVAHRTAIQQGGRTVAVLGAPLEEDYPAANAELRAAILRDHLAVSQFAPGHPILRTNFPQRNRTMALLSDATVIVEAGDTSGSLSQGWEALRLGRPLFILKSVAEAQDLKWPAEMLGYGAIVLDEPEPMFEFLPPSPAASLAAFAT